MDNQPIKHSLRIGLTGGIGSGKTTVSELFIKLDVPVIDADKISHQITQSGQPAFSALINEFGPDIIGENGELRRDYLRNLVFKEESQRKRLEAITHPLIHNEIEKKINCVNYPYCIISIPLLIETRLETIVDRILVIDIAEQLQIIRTCKRDGVSQEDVERIMQSQIKRETRLQAADDVINNDKDTDKLQKQVITLHEKYLAMSKSRKYQNF